MMSTGFSRTIARWRNPFRRLLAAGPLASAEAGGQDGADAGVGAAVAGRAEDVAIAPDDPLLAYFLQNASATELDRIHLESPALHALRAAGVQLVIPLVSQGDLIGLIHLGPRRSEQEYTSDDRRMLNNLAVQAAPAVRVAQLVRQQQDEARARERVEQELRVARLIQETLLPKTLPEVDQYSIAAYWQPARAVGGDFYDFIAYPDGRLALVIGDVTDKGVPAAMVMASTRTLLRAAAERLVDPGAVLARANDLLCPDMPPKMFVTCLFAVLDPNSGLLRYANAGHDLPYRRHATGVDELRATGMPLGLLPGMRYEEKEITLLPGETVVFYSDGIVEAHSPSYEMFSFGRLRNLIGGHDCGDDLVPYLLEQLTQFTGENWEQEDDVTIVTLQRWSPQATTPGALPPAVAASTEDGPPMRHWKELAEFSVPSIPGNERQAMLRVAEILADENLPPLHLERLKTAVAEATMNAMEHGNGYLPDLAVRLQVAESPSAVRVRITDHGGGRAIPQTTAPDIDAKLAGLQSPRGWGLFLIRNMVDELTTSSDDVHHTIELVVNRHKEN
jgi:serine phosphatase RsbU (regulator of sigma subunit)/anti-sigma regulatory factor (Ser/Thr protein kinase)